MEKKFKVGDRVRFIKDRDYVKKGSVGTIKWVHEHDGDYAVEVDDLTVGWTHSVFAPITVREGSGCWASESYLEKIEKSETPKFKVGDRVIANGSVDGIPFKNDHGKVIKHYSGDGYCIEFDRNIAGHDAMGSGKPDHCWWVDAKFLQLEVKEEIIIYREGQKVIAKNTVTGKTAKAKCHEDDTFDFEIGAKLALERLYTHELLNKFEEGKCYVFDLDTYKKDCLYRGGKCYSWADECHGQDVKVTAPRNGRVKGLNGKTYSVAPSWCKEVEKPKYYNAKVVCVGNTANPTRFTVGKIYEFVDGYLTDNHGEKAPRYHEPVESLEEFHASGCLARFIEVIE